MTHDTQSLFTLDRALTPEERKRLQRRYEPQGYAALPGTGPAGETCKTCKHYALRELASTYRKWGLMRAYWTGGVKTDIRAGSPACKRWEKGEGSLPDRSIEGEDA